MSATWATGRRPLRNWRNKAQAVMSCTPQSTTATPGVEACAEDGSGMPAAVCADMVFKAIANNDLYVLPNNDPNIPFDVAVARAVAGVAPRGQQSPVERLGRAVMRARSPSMRATSESRPVRV